LTYNVVPMTNELGCIELVRDCVALRDVSSLKQKMKASDGDVMMTNLITSSAGAFIGSYIMGVRDRHFDNILIRETDFVLFHIDFNYCLGQRVTGLDANLFGVTKDLYDVFGPDKYVIFVGAACNAFKELRHFYEELINFACLAFSFIHPYKTIKQYIGKQLRMHENDKTAIDWLQKTLMDAPNSTQTKLKNDIHKMATG